ncbi:MAG: hypothetical protein QOD77_1025 [Thermoplasmata archaeon]|jgi:hypothetical protein|nr:hypothetical protein [Thermoplasmata archaeon]
MRLAAADGKRSLLACLRLAAFMRLVRAATVAALVLVAGCSAPSAPAPTSSTTQQPEWAWMGYDLRQCEQPMWADAPPADHAEAVRMAREHYAAKGARVTDGRFTDAGGVYPAVCGGPTGQRVHLNVTGDATALSKDGWTTDTPAWFRYTFQQCQQPVWSPAPPTNGDTQDAWVEQAREHYEGKGVRILDGKSSFSEASGAPMCGQPSNFHVHLQLPPAEDPTLLVADGWEWQREAA